MQKGTCKHWRGFRDKACLAGVDFRAFNGGTDEGLALYLPCSNLFDDTRKLKGIQAIPCALREEPSDEDIKEHEADVQRAFERIEKAEPIIDRVRKENKSRCNSGIEDCPACGKKDYLHWSIAPNGHIGMRCRTEDCISFRE